MMAATAPKATSVTAASRSRKSLSMSPPACLPGHPRPILCRETTHRPEPCAVRCRYCPPMSMGGAAQDLAEHLAESESLFRALFDANILGVTIVDEQRIVEANDAFLRMVGYSRGELLAGALEWAAMTPSEHAVSDVRAMHLLETTGTAEPWEKEYIRKDASRVPVLIGAATVHRDPFRAVCFVLDLGERHRAMERVKRLHTLASDLSAALSADEVADAILVHGVAATDASSAVLGLPMGRELILAHHHRHGVAARAPDRLSMKAAAPMPEAMRTAHPVLLGSRAAWSQRFPDSPPRDDFEAFAAVPLIGEHGAIGCMGLGFAQPRTFDVGDLELLQVIARQGAQALERAALYEQRAHVARTLQQGLLPSELPEIPGLDVASAYQPLGSGHEVGGDFYDVFATEEGWAAAIGDVCGKGVEAAVVTGMVRHTLRALELGHGEPAAVLRRLNQAVRRHATDDRFCSVALVHLTALQRGFRVDLACAGHPPPLVLRADASVEDLDACGTLLGIEDDLHLSPVSTELLPGDALVLYTDGITEARVRGELFGLARLRATLAELAGAPAAEVAAGIRRAVGAFAPGPAADDQALLVLRAL